MPFRQHGKQFLFYTFCLAGRPQRLSRLEKGAKRPLLSAEGEAVRALLRALHRLDSSLAASEYCIMPDHVHFLLVVDCERRAEPFKPLVFAHWWQESAEAAILAARAASAAGEVAKDGGLAAPRTPGAAAASRTPGAALAGY